MIAAAATRSASFNEPNNAKNSPKPNATAMAGMHSLRRPRRERLLIKPITTLLRSLFQYTQGARLW